MDSKKIIIILVIICIVLASALGIVIFSNNSKNSDNVAVNNTTNITSNVTNDTVNATLVSSSDSSGYGDFSGYEESSVSSSEPEYGSDSYVDRWDESNKNGDSWAYLHDQPVKTDDEGNEYKRMYDEDTGEGYWYKMDK